MLIRVFVLFAILALSASSTYAANWYMSNTAQGGHDGTSWGNAWAPSQVVWGSSGVKAGDTLYIDGGATSLTYNATSAVITVGASGTSGSSSMMSISTNAAKTATVTWNPVTT